MRHLPIFMEIRDRLCLLVGGGEVASRKARLLLRAGGRVAVVAEALGGELAERVADGSVLHRAVQFEPIQLDGAALVIAATDDQALNARIARQARLRGIPVNVVDDPALSSFIMPSIVDRSPVLVAVSTGGTAPVLARRIRAEIERLVPAALGRFADFAGRARPRVRDRLAEPGRRRRFWEEIFDGEVAELAAAGHAERAEAAFAEAFDRAARGDGETAGEVFLVGAGPGDPELMTLRAARLLGTADAIVYDSLVGADALDFARRDAELIPAGKRAGRPSARQEDISELMIRLAREGKRVVRLKGGDPFVFGRGGEEMEALIAAGVRVTVVPGVTAATGCGAAAGIPLTHRDHADRCVIVTGHGKDGLPEFDWAALAQKRQTLVIYMGLGNLPEIARNLIAHGLAPATPAAAIDSATTPDERVIVGTLADLPARAATAGITGPATIIIGDVVRLARAEPSAETRALAQAG